MVTNGQCQVGFPVQFGPIGPGRQSVQWHDVPGGHAHQAPFSVHVASLAAANEAGHVVALFDGQSVAETGLTCHLF